MTEAEDQTDTLTLASPASATISRRLIETVDVELEAFLGSAAMTVADLTALSPGAVVALDAQLNSAVELRLNGIAVARGELVAVEDRFGIRLTEITQWPD
jgi:flagellar motor switch protein FliN/FliY